MKRIFGYFSFNGPVQETCKSRMATVFNTGEARLKTLEFSQGSLYILFEQYQLPEAAHFYTVDQKNGRACFVLGNIHAYDGDLSGPVPDINLARWILQLYQRNNVSFVKNLRGIFNIVLWEKNRLVLLNDILGLSPMCFLSSQEGCFFCTDPEPIAEMKKDHRVDNTAVIDFLVYGFIPQGKTFFKGLSNQAPGSALTIERTGCNESTLDSFQEFKGKSADHAKTLNLLKDGFQEAVALRAPSENVLAALTGGWDTRFILANLLNLGKKVTAFTFARDNRDVLIAHLIAKRYKLKHIVKKEKNLSEKFRSERGFNFRSNFSSSSHKDEFGNYFTTPIMHGGFGTEVLGYVPETFPARLVLDRENTAKKIFVRKFLQKNGANKSSVFYKDIFFKHSDPVRKNFVHCFVTQNNRSYLSVHFGRESARPLLNVGYMSTHPFADHKFIALLSSLDGKRCFNYRIYSEVFEKFYPEFLKIPWTYARYRKTSLAIAPYRQTLLQKTFSENPSFKAFLNNNPIIRVSDFVLSHRLWESYILYSWFRACNDLLHKEDQLTLTPNLNP